MFRSTRFDVLSQQDVAGTSRNKGAVSGMRPALCARGGLGVLQGKTDRSRSFLQALT